MSAEERRHRHQPCDAGSGRDISVIMAAEETLDAAAAEEILDAAAEILWSGEMEG
eukprot:COSAG01_NODE_16277_length_1251_cov_57.984375_2_plen_54_part_01